MDFELGRGACPNRELGIWNRSDLGWPFLKGRPSDPGLRMRKFGIECGLLVPESGLGTEYLELRLMGLAYDRCEVDDWRYAKSGSRLIRMS